ncbi:flagellar motility protein MotE (MotC chaperone) [Streptohalobacillus salinus]|uniref:Flagellar motility protein MotE (MotC chaperone) n=2 Tax=Streptohalobacillus salinus TaxID=621096 RepID=A0A2V3WFL8_9BACI|nr:flagellar motility protein MotE (MotC chaperone) [Streptohalobacillus salinus]
MKHPTDSILITEIGETMANKKAPPKKKRLLQTLLLILVPLILSITIIYIVLSLLGLEPISKTKNFMNNVPVLESLVVTDQEAAFAEREADYQSQIENYQTEIDRLSQELSGKDAEIADLNAQIEQLNAEIDQYLNNLDDRATREERIQALTETYATMEAISAANILMNTDQDIVLAVLQELSPEQRSAILSAMPAEDAGRYTNLLAN